MTPVTGHARDLRRVCHRPVGPLFPGRGRVERNRPNDSKDKDNDNDDHVTTNNSNANGEAEQRHPTSFKGGKEDTLRTPTPQRRKSSIVIRRKSSLLVQQMPGIRLRRESLAPFD
mmetsp:Transcript_17421/g.48114  ORF Transcript_17421/g.48114 Transcript_17421/m.48114 type:complete len:115 (-) Transcript_17421:207-551(-)